MTTICFYFKTIFVNELLLNLFSDDGFQKPTLIPYVPTGSLQVPSNVTRIARALKRTGLDGVHQIIYYHSGVGTGSTVLDAITGGLLGTGISEVRIDCCVKIV